VSRAIALARREDGIAMLMVVFLAALLLVLGVGMMEIIKGETTRSSDALVSETSYQAAEAGLDDYIAKLLDNNVYYSQYVHPGEATRRMASGTTVSAGNVWTGGLTWTYPNGKNAWRSVGNGYEYDLQITAPSASQPAIRILSTGRKAGSTSLSQYRVIEALVRPSSLADFQMFANADITYGSAATTYGKIYAGIDSSNVRHNVTHFGTAYGNIYAEGSVLGGPTLMGGAQTYNSTNIRTVIKTPPNFADFLTSLTDIQRAAQASGVYLNNTSIGAWRIVFNSDGTFTAATCTLVSGADPGGTQPTCGSTTTYNVPSNGAVYIAQTAIVSGTVNGRVTIASNDDIIVPANITYNDGHCTTTGGTADDVLGLVAKNDVIVAQWAPTNLTWCAATLAQSGQWHSWSNDGSHGTMTFKGSTATNLGGSMSLFTTRVYQYDDTLQYLQPPWFPTLSDAYTILLFRERSPSTTLS
jgi:Tfp pilus assembly protein PilX